MKNSDKDPSQKKEEDHKPEDHGIIYLLVHPAYPITSMHYFPSVFAFLLSEVPAILLHLRGHSNNHHEDINNDVNNSTYSHSNQNSYPISNLYISDILFTSFFLWVLLSNVFIGRARDRESHYDPRRDKVAIGLNAGFDLLASGATAFMSLFKPVAHGLGGVATGLVSQGTAAAVGGIDTLTNERILWNHYTDRSPDQDGYMRFIDLLGCRGEASITRLAELISSYGFWTINLNFVGIHLTDATRVAFRTGIGHAERFSIDLLVTFMNDLLFYVQSTADIYLISRTLQALRIADSSGSTRGTWQGFNPEEKPAVLRAGDAIAQEAEHVAHKVSSAFHHLGEVFHHPDQAPDQTPKKNAPAEDNEDRKLTAEEYDELHGIKPANPPAEETDALQEEANTLGAMIWQIFEEMAFLNAPGEEVTISTRNIGINTEDSISDPQAAQVEEHHGFLGNLIYGHLHNAVSVATNTDGLMIEPARPPLFTDDIISSEAILTMASTMPAGSRMSINLPNNLRCNFCVVHKDKAHTKKITMGNVFSEGRDKLSEHITAYHFCDKADNHQDKVLLKMKIPIEGTENIIQIEIMGQPSYQEQL
jgi:hypothetical protein